MNYDEIESGSEMDKLIALWLGYSFITYPNGTCPLTEHWSMPDGMIDGFHPPPFSTDMGRAWEVVERMRDLGHFANVHQRLEIAHCSIEDFDGEELLRVRANTAPLAICRAALKSTQKEM